MVSINTVLIVLAFVCAILAAIGVGVGRINLLGASLAFYFASILF